MTPIAKSSNGTPLYECKCPTCGLVRIQDKRKIGKLCMACSRKARRDNMVSGTRLYRIWSGMMARCKYPSTDSYKYYGARGITVCSDWMKFKAFSDWAVSNGYSDDLEIDRVDSDGNYTPQNCVFISHQLNSQKRRNLRCTLEQASEIKKLLLYGSSMVEASNETGVPYMAVWHINKGNTWRNA